MSYHWLVSDFYKTEYKSLIKTHLNVHVPSMKVQNHKNVFEILMFKIPLRVHVL